jgi:hypothetical protein
MFNEFQISPLQHPKKSVNIALIKSIIYYGSSLICGLLVFIISSSIPANQSMAESLRITFQSENGMSLAGTLVLPPVSNKKSVPAMLWLQGSGPTDRNGNQEP